MTDHLHIEYIPISTLKEYKHNAKLHTKGQIEQIARSITDYGMNDPIAIDENNVIIEGHGRLRAIQLLQSKGLYQLDTVPVIRLLHLTDQQKKAYILIHNQLTLNTGFDLDILGEELKGLTELNMGDFGFLDAAEISMTQELKKEAEKREYADRKLDILNLGKAEYEGAPPYDIPILRPVKKLPHITQWIGFNEVLTDKHPENKGVHFFIDDYLFERIWNRPDDYIQILRRYKAITSPDFSTYGDMPLITQIYNHYRKHWTGRYFQDHGITVIPTIRSSTDHRSFNWFLDGEPADSIVIVSSMYKDKTDEERAISQKFWNTMRDKIHPRKVLIYGEPVKGWDGIPTETIPTFTSKHRRDHEDTND